VYASFLQTLPINLGEQPNPVRCFRSFMGLITGFADYPTPLNAPAWLDGERANHAKPNTDSGDGILSVQEKLDSTSSLHISTQNSIQTARFVHLEMRPPGQALEIHFTSGFVMILDFCRNCCHDSVSSEGLAS
jgi:hypothetical protein